MKKTVLFTFIILLNLHCFAENWIGQAATYRLIEGTPTASNEPFKKDGLTAASNGFKIGANVEVTNVTTGKSVTVTINDRIDGESKYFLLLSPAAAKEIDLEWETGLVVVSADFNSLNSTDALPIGGLLPVDEDADKYKILPKIEWPEDESTDIAEMITEPIELTDDVIDEIELVETVIDETPLTNAYTPEKIETAKAPIIRELPVTPELSIVELIIPGDKLIEPYVPVKKIKIEEIVQEKPVITEVKKEEPKKVEPIVKEEKKVEVKNIEPVKETKKEELALKNEFKEIKWTEKFDKDKIYIKFFSSSKHDDFSIKYFNFKKLFGDVLAVRKGNMYHLITTAVDESSINKSIEAIRNFGFRDAYIIKGNSW